MAEIVFETPAGEERKVAAIDGESLMRIAVKQDVHGIIGECGGELSCGTCHVYVDSAWNDKISPTTDEERDMLEVVNDRRPTSRLACQIIVSDRIDGMRVTIAEEN